MSYPAGYTQEQKKMREELLSRYSCLKDQGPLPQDMNNMSFDEFQQCLKDDEKNCKVFTDEEPRLAANQNREARKREAIKTREMRKYCMKNPIGAKSFKADIERYSSIYVFCVSWAKLESPVYQRFIQSDLTADGFGKVYIGTGNRLASIIGTDPGGAELRPGESGYKKQELRPGLHKIGGMLDMEEVGALLTDITEEEVLTKLREYRESDFVKPGNTPARTLGFQAGEFVPLPSTSSSAMKLCPKLKELGMPVELCGRAIKLTEKFVVCEDGVRVTENAAKILKHLEIKMFDYVLVPMGYWSASTGETKYYPWMDQVPRCG